MSEGELMAKMHFQVYQFVPGTKRKDVPPASVAVAKAKYREVQLTKIYACSPTASNRSGEL